MGDERRSGPRSRAWLLLTVAATCAFATGVVDRPAGLGWDRFYDVVLYNLPYLAAAAACRQAATRVPAERLAWHALALTLVLNAAGNLPQALAEAADGSEPLLLLAHLLSLGGYLALHVALVVMLRARVHRFQQSMWLDGLMGALGSLAAGVAFFLGPYLHPATGRPAELVALLWPTMDLVLLAVLVAMAAVLGVRLDRTLLALTAALCAVCVGDLAVFSAVMAGGYTDGGPLELTWLAGVLLVVVAAHRAHPAAASPTRRRPVFGWRLLALPLVCNLASLTVLAHGWQNQLPAAAAWLAMACVMTAIVRTVVSLREVRTFHEVRQQAHTDELTGLGNRRALLEGWSRCWPSPRHRRPQPRRTSTGSRR